LLTGDPLKLALTALGFILTGMVMGNSVLLGLGLIPLIFTIVSTNIQGPSEPMLQSLPESIIVNVDDELVLDYRVEFEAGSGNVTLGGDIPPHFELLEGNNIQTFWVDRKNSVIQMSYKIKCTKRGVYQIRAPRWEICHSLGLEPTRLGQFDEVTELIVKPRILTARRVRNQKLLSQIPMPAESRIKIGVPTTSFKELREYSHGDSYRQINWKATARKGMHGRPVINEYEREGKRMVFILLDTSTSLGLGTSLKNSFEYAVQATLGLSEYYLSRQCMVGLCLFNSGLQSLKNRSSRENLFLFPEIGRVQQFKIHRTLMSTELKASNSSLSDAVNQMKRHIYGTNPLFVVVTRVHEKNKDEITKGITDFRKYSRRSRGLSNVMLINVSGYSLSINKPGDRTAAELLEHRETSQMAAFRQLGITTVNWNPSESTITDVLLSQVKRR
jgi:uncharacterized protein (DUF58 family)